MRAAGTATGRYPITRSSSRAIESPGPLEASPDVQAKRAARARLRNWRVAQNCHVRPDRGGTGLLVPQLDADSEKTLRLAVGPHLPGEVAHERRRRRLPAFKLGPTGGLAAGEEELLEEITLRNRGPMGPRGCPSLI